MSRRKQASKRSRERGLSQSVRHTCSACSSSLLRWMDEPHALKVFGPLEVRRARVDLGRGPLDFWRCERCSEWGALSAAEPF